MGGCAERWDSVTARLSLAHSTIDCSTSLIMASGLTMQPVFVRWQFGQSQFLEVTHPSEAGSGESPNMAQQETSPQDFVRTKRRHFLASHQRWWMPVLDVLLND